MYSECGKSYTLDVPSFVFRALTLEKGLRSAVNVGNLFLVAMDFLLIREFTVVEGFKHVVM